MVCRSVIHQPVVKKFYRGLAQLVEQVKAARPHPEQDVYSILKFHSKDHVGGSNPSLPAIESKA